MNNQTFYRALLGGIMSLCLSGSMLQAAQTSYIPRGFSWISEEPRMAGLSRPAGNRDIKFLDVNNVGLLVTLTESKLPASHFEGTTVESLHLPVIDFSTPSMEQIDQFIQRANEIHDQGKGVAVHCAGGIGRTGLFLACWLVAVKGMEADAAIQLVRELRYPAIHCRSIETEQQEQCVRDYAHHVAAKKGTLQG